MMPVVEVRDCSRTGYLVPGRDALGLWPDGRVVGTPPPSPPPAPSVEKLGSETVLVFGPESVSYERSRGIDWCILREILARVFFAKIPKINKNHISNISRI